MKESTNRSKIAPEGWPPLRPGSWFATQNSLLNSSSKYLGRRENIEQSDHR